MTAILHCGHCVGSPKRKPRLGGFPASATGWGEFKSMNMQIRTVQDFCVAWLHKRWRVPAKIRNADGGKAGEQKRWLRMGFRLHSVG
jgi:hypothetical protein